MNVQEKDQALEAVAAAKPVIKARALRKGDTVGIVAPASPALEPGYMQYSFQWLAKLGLKYKLGKHLDDAYGVYAGSDKARAEELMRFFADPEIAAIMPTRGGNGAVRILPLLDFDLIAANPKIFIGYSDITGLLIPIHQQTGLVTFHGPTLNTFFRTEYTYNNFKRAITSTKPLGTIEDPQESIWNPPYPPARMVINQGTACGRLVGGCMTLIRQLMGTPFEMETEGKIVFLEDLEEEPHTIDRFLSQLLLAGKLQKAAGIIICQCMNCRPGESHRNVLQLNYGLEYVLKERLSGLKIPIVYGLRAGHGEHKATLPLGVMASLDVNEERVRFQIEESALV